MRIEIKESEKFSVLFKSVMVEKLNRPITGISIDSRNVKENDLFVAIQGTQFDGHSFIKDVHELGVSCAIVKKADKDLDLQQVIVKDPISAIILLAENGENNLKYLLSV
jgi:UDP-N-acetylmuramyl pentapeptide synthase